MIEVKVTGNGQRVIDNNIRKISANTRIGIKNGWTATRPRLLKACKASMNGPKSGRSSTVYWSKSGRRLKRGRRHKASAVGESPAVVSGRLLRSLRAASSGNSLRFSAGTEYAPYLEEQGEPHYASRSFLGRTIDSEERDTVKTLQQEIKKSVQFGGGKGY